MTNTSRKTLTVRLPVELYNASAHLARKRKVSLNALVEQGLQTLGQQEAEKALWDEFTLLGGDEEASAVGFAELAQSEVAADD